MLILSHRPMILKGENHNGLTHAEGLSYKLMWDLIRCTVSLVTGGKLTHLSEYLFQF
jgi:hypothetical protein